jgi:hypothetical protein
MAPYIFILLITVHLFLFAFTAFDLITKSKRSRKVKWFLLLLLIPFVSIIFYNHSKQRRKYRLH